MDQLTLEQAAKAHSEGWIVPTYAALRGSFKAGAEWQQKYLLAGFKAIAGWPGNLPDNRLTSKTGPNDAALRGEMVVTMRQIAIDIIKKFEPDYEPRQD